MTSLPDYKQMEMNVMNLKKLSVLKKQQEMKYISTSSYSERPKKDKDAELEDDKLLSQEENISHHQTLSPQRDEPILHAETVKVEDQSTAKKLSSFDRPQYLNDKSQPSYQSLRSNYHRNGSLFQDHPNSTIQDHFVTAKPLLRDVDEEESIRELDEYLGDQEHCHRNPDAMSFQDRQSTGHWSSTRHPEARRTESLQSYYPHQDRQYLSKADNYENLRNYQKNPEPNYHSVKNSECFNSCSKQSDPARNLKDQFYQSIKVPQQPYSSDNQGLTSLSHLLSSSHDWKNIQEVVRIAFKYVTDSFNSQQNQLKYLYSELDSKASKSELSSRLSNKASQSDINKCYADCAKLIETKQDIEGIKY